MSSLFKHIILFNLSNLLMKKLLVLFLFALAVEVSYGQTVLLNDDFESYTDFVTNNFGQWTGLDLDQLYTWTLGGKPEDGWYATWPNAGTKMAYQIFNPSKANVTNNSTDYTQEFRNFDPHSGNKYAGCWNAKSEVSYDTNQDWLISPVVTLGASGNTLTFWIKELSNSYGDEHYKVGIYTGSGSPTSSNNFTIISGTSHLTPTTNWVQMTYNLDSYTAQTIRIGIICETPSDLGSMLMVDDFKITTNLIATSTDRNNYSQKTRVFPNPTKGEINVISESNIRNIEMYNTLGQKIKNIDKRDNISDLNKGMYILKVNFENQNTETINILKN